MANCNNLFDTFNQTIKLSESNRTKLSMTRDNLRDRMQRRHGVAKEALNYGYDLIFQSQGSFVMDTIITPKDNDFDLDDGVYFQGNLTREARPSEENFHKYVLSLVGNYQNVRDKDTCLRVNYQNEGFHIDLPIYYAQTVENPELAHKKDGWTLSHPVKFIAWFEGKVDSGFQLSYILESKMYPEYVNWLSDIRKKDAQLRRLVRYLKAWSDHLRGDMPPGIVMTILAGNNFRLNERDDIALRDTLVNIRYYLDGNGFKCPRPTTPVGEDLFENYSSTKKTYFSDRLDSFIKSANQALEIANQRDACLKWQKHLGDRFPCALAKDEVEGVKSHSQKPILGGTAKSA